MKTLSRWKSIIKSTSACWTRTGEVPSWRSSPCVLPKRETEYAVCLSAIVDVVTSEGKFGGWRRTEEVAERGDMKVREKTRFDASLLKDRASIKAKFGLAWLPVPTTRSHSAPSPSNPSFAPRQALTESQFQIILLPGHKSE
jgi:hypothetical protein